MSHMMIVVEFEDRPKHRQFIELMRGRAQRSRAAFVTALCFPARPL